MCAALYPAQIESPTTTVTVPVEFDNLNSPDRWYNGFWVMFKRSFVPGRPPQVWTYDRRGNEALRRTDISVPGAHHTIVHAAAAATNGDVIVSVELWSPGGQAATALCRITRAGETEYVVRTESFLAKSLVVMPDGQIWAFGTKQIGPFVAREADYDTVERYDERGRLLSRLLPRSSFGVKYDPTLVHDLGGPRVVASSTRVGVFSPGAKYWAEFTSSGKAVDAFFVAPPSAPGDNTPAEMLTLAMTENNQVYASFLVSSTGRPVGSVHYGIYRLDRTRRAWVFFARESLDRRFKGLYGADGDFLILRSGCCEYGWFPSTATVQEGSKAQF
jgi:hypothetical protein